jgi:hypothetical protein
MLALSPLVRRYRFQAHLEQILGADGSVRYKDILRGRLSGRLSQGSVLAGQGLPQSRSAVMIGP